MNRSFQTFEQRGDPDAAARNLPMLRDEMKKLGIDGLLVPHDDEYLNEYTPERFERLRWASGFSGSAGVLLLLADTAVLFVDGRYTAQARQETTPGSFEFVDLRTTPPAEWLKQNPGRVKRLGYAPALHTRFEIRRLEKADWPGRPEPVPLGPHPVDRLWTNRPPWSPAPPVPHPLEYAGESSADKRRRLAAAVARRGADACVVANPNSVAWLFNLRGGDVQNTPVALCRAIAFADGRAAVFFAGHKVSDAVRRHLGEDVHVAGEEIFEPELRALGREGCAVLMDPAACPDGIVRALEAGGARLIEGEDPVAPLRAVKNDIEIDGARAAHRRDGVALVRFLRWLEEHWESGTTEIDAVRRLESIRAGHPEMRGPSFDTIAGSGPNGAIIHYRVSKRSNRTLQRGDLFLLDSGAQYPDGTTDVTRTIPLGPQDGERRDRYTRVLQGHIALSKAVFPPDTSGQQLDALARQPLWEAGCDYGHGTGHGVGSYLGVHEGPQAIAKKASATPLQPGMVLSIEPGFYREGDYGIRIENLVVVREAAGLCGMLSFEPLTRVPIDTSMLEPGLMTPVEIDWLNRYHRQVLDDLQPLLDRDDAEWLQRATAPVHRR